MVSGHLSYHFVCDYFNSYEGCEEAEMTNLAILTVNICCMVALDNSIAAVAYSYVSSDVYNSSAKNVLFQDGRSRSRDFRYVSYKKISCAISYMEKLQGISSHLEHEPLAEEVFPSL